MPGPDGAPPLRHPREFALPLSLLFTLAGPAEGRAADAPPVRGVLVDAPGATPGALRDWKAAGGNAVVVLLDESVTRPAWEAVAGAAAGEGLRLYAWVEVGRNPAMADAHPEWMASPGGHHDDWRRRFPDAPRAGAGEAVKLWPWVPIGYGPAYRAHVRRVNTLLADLPGVWAGVFLNDLQGGPSACGCGNDQCRWALDYGSEETAAKLPGDSTAARFVSGLRARYPGKDVVPVWVTECESADLPAARGGTGHCGGVPCAGGACWPAYHRAFAPLAEAAGGAVAVGLWPESFRRSADWPAAGLGLFLKPPKGPAFPADRAVAVVPEGDGRWREQVAEARGGSVVARIKVEQGWTPRVVKAP